MNEEFDLSHGATDIVRKPLNQGTNEQQGHDSTRGTTHIKDLIQDITEEYYFKSYYGIP